MTKYFSRLHHHLATAFVLLAAFCATAMEPEIERQLDEQVEKELQAAMNNVLDATTFREQYMGIAHEITAPEKMPEELYQEVNETIQREALEQYPPSQKNVFEKEAEELWKLFEKGKQIKIELKDGSVVEDYLREIGQQDVLLGIRRVKFSDMSPDSLARFIQARAEARRQAYVAEKVASWNNERQAYKLQIREEVEVRIFTDAGYILRLGEWISETEYFQAEYNEARIRLADRLRPMLKTKVYYEAGYRLYDGVWLTKGEIKKRQILEQQANEFTPEEYALITTLNQENEANAKAQAPVDASDGGLDDF